MASWAITTALEGTFGPVKHALFWRFEAHVIPDPNSNDSRDSIVEFRVTDGTHRFYAQSEAQGRWLLSVLEAHSAPR